jgi:hypothetical protein
VLGMIVVARPVEVGWHYRDEICAVLLTKGLYQLDPGDLGHRVPLIGRLQWSGRFRHLAATCRVPSLALGEGVRGSGLPRFRARSGSAATNPREWPRPRPGRDIEIRRVKNAQTRSRREGIAAAYSDFLANDGQRG